MDRDGKSSRRWKFVDSILSWRCCFKWDVLSQMQHEMLLAKYRKQYFKKLKEKDIDEEKNSLEKWYKIHSLNKVIHNIKHTENENPGYVFEVKQLENKYVEILNSYG